MTDGSPSSDDQPEGSPAADNAAHGYSSPMFVSEELPDRDRERSEDEDGARSGDGFDASDTAAVSALDRLIRHHEALERLDPVTSQSAKDALQDQIDSALVDLDRILVARLKPDGADERAALLKKIIDAYHDPEASAQERSTWVSAAILAAVAMVASTGAAPLGALMVGDVAWKESVKAAVSGLLTGLATLAADRTLQRRAAKDHPSAPAARPGGNVISDVGDIKGESDAGQSSRAPEQTGEDAQGPRKKRSRLTLGKPATAMPDGVEDDQPETGTRNIDGRISPEVAQERRRRVTSEEASRGLSDITAIPPDERSQRRATPPSP